MKLSSMQNRFSLTMTQVSLQCCLKFHILHTVLDNSIFACLHYTHGEVLLKGNTAVDVRRREVTIDFITGTVKMLTEVDT